MLEAWRDGVFKSTDGGANWTALNVTSSVNVLVVNPQSPETLYAGTGSGVFKSTNNGATWTATDIGFYTTLGALVINPHSPQTLYAGTGSGVFKSTDGGANWTVMNDGLTDTDISALAINPQTPDTLYAGTWGGGVFKSTDGGANWTARNTGLDLIHGDIVSLAINPQVPEIIYAGTYRGGLFRSVDGGANWMATSVTSASVYPIAINPQAPEILYAGIDVAGGSAGSGLFKSTDGGETWTASLTSTEVRTLAINPQAPSALYAGTGSGVFKSTDGGANWTAINKGLTDMDISALAINPQTLDALYAGTSGGGVFQIQQRTCSNPVIGAQPQSQTIQSGQPADLWVNASGTAPVSYQWYRGSSGDHSNPISEAKSSSYTTPALIQTTSYWVRMINSCGYADSNTATITVNIPCISPSITSQPQSRKIQSGQAATMSVTASGTPPLSYQWYWGSAGDTSNPVSGALSSSYTTPALTQTTSYWVRMSNACGHADSDTAIITTSSTYTIWSPSMSVGPDAGGLSVGVELGVKFRSDVPGYISGIRFYKHAQNTGTHTGSLWTTGGARLGQVTFTSEMVSGWQEAHFATPIAIAANTTYVASYFAPTGHFAFSANYFTSAGGNNSPIHALRSGVDGPNGVFAFSSASSFPISSYQNGNYWIDVVFVTD